MLVSRVVKGSHARDPEARSHPCGGRSRIQQARREERTLARLRALRSGLIDPTIALHHGRVVKRTGMASLLSSEASYGALRHEVQNGMAERNLC